MKKKFLLLSFCFCFVSYVFAQKTTTQTVTAVVKGDTVTKKVVITTTLKKGGEKSYTVTIDGKQYKSLVRISNNIVYYKIADGMGLTLYPQGSSRPPEITNTGNVKK